MFLIAANAVMPKVNTGGIAASADIRDIKGPIYFSSIFLPIAVAVLIIISLAALMSLLKYFKRQKEIKAVAAKKLAHEIAYEKLEKLMNKNLPDEGRMKEFFFELSLIVRYYLEDRFDLRAPEMTTEEFLTKLKDTKELLYEHKSLLREFLAYCDLVKFAKYGPARSDIDSSFQSAKKLIDQTKEVEEKAAVNTKA
jgi:hypothetical protein